MRKSVKGRTPDNYNPDDAELLAAVRRHPDTPTTLRTICAAIWPELPWASVSPGKNCAQKVRPWPAGPEMFAAHWLRGKLDALVQNGRLRHGPADQTEVDELAGLTYLAQEDVA